MRRNIGYYGGGVKEQRRASERLEGQGVCATAGHQHVEPKAPGQPGDMRPQGPRARPDGSEQALLRVQPAWGDLHRYHRGLLRMHLMLWNAVSDHACDYYIIVIMSRCLFYSSYSSANSGIYVATMQREFERSLVVFTLKRVGY